MPEEADHFGVRGWADEGHVAVSEGAVDLQVEARFGGGVPVLSEGLHSVCRQVKIQVMGTDLRSGHLKSEKEENHARCSCSSSHNNIIPNIQGRTSVSFGLLSLQSRWIIAQFCSVVFSIQLRLPLSPPSQK